MVSIKALDTLTPADLWREVPLEEEFWEEAQERQRRMLKVLLEEAPEREQLELLAAGRYRRVETRQGYRNGSYQRDLATQIGIVTGIRVPRCRTGLAETTALEVRPSGWVVPISIMKIALVIYVQYIDPTVVFPLSEKKNALVASGCFVTDQDILRCCKGVVFSASEVRDAVDSLIPTVIRSTRRRAYYLSEIHLRHGKVATV